MWKAKVVPSALAVSIFIIRIFPIMTVEVLASEAQSETEREREKHDS